MVEDDSSLAEEVDQETKQCDQELRNTEVYVHVVDRSKLCVVCGFLHALLCIGYTFAQTSLNFDRVLDSFTVCSLHGAWVDTWMYML